jgi:hypothetical protein
MFKPSDLSNFFGSEGYFFQPMFKSIDYTDGVKFLNDNGANWLVVKALAMIQCEKLMEKHDYFLAIRCTVKDKSAVFTIEDGDEKVIYTENIEYTDLPCDILMFCEMGEKPVLMLASEH